MVNAHRKALERLWKDRCSIFVKEKVTDGNLGNRGWNHWRELKMPTTKTRKPKTAEAAPPVSNVPVFTKRNILTFQRYAKRRDLLSVLLEDGKEYTMEQVDSLLQNFFKKGKVN